ASAVAPRAAADAHVVAVLGPRAHEKLADVFRAVDAAKAFDAEHAPRETARALGRPSPYLRSVERPHRARAEEREPDDGHRERRHGELERADEHHPHRSLPLRFGATATPGFAMDSPIPDVIAYIDPHGETFRNVLVRL